MSLFREFKKFAVKGNVIDMAVGVVLGTAFGKVVSSLVADVIMPPIGVFVGGVDFSALAFTLREAAEGRDAVVLSYGRFAQALVDFVIIAGAVFVLVKGMNRLQTKAEEKAPEAPKPPRQEQLLEEIRDLLSERS